MTKIKKGTRALQLLEVLLDHYPNFDSDELDFENIRKQLSLQKTIKKVTIQNALSDIRIVLKNYLSYLELEHNPDVNELFLLKFFSRKNLSNDFDKQFRRIEKMLNKDDANSIWSHLRKQELYHEYYFSKITQQEYATDKLYHCLDEVDRFTLAAKLRYGSEIFNGHNLLEGTAEDRWGLNQLDAFKADSDMLYLKLYESLFQMNKSSSVVGFYEVKGIFIEDAFDLPPREALIVFSYLVNFCNAQFQKGNKEFLKELFRLYQFVFKKEKLRVDEIVNHLHLLNAIEVASDLGCYVWGYQLIRGNADHILKKEREYTLSLANAILSFKKENFEECAGFLVGIETSEPETKIRGKWLRLKCFYELRYSKSLLLNYSRNFKNGIERKRLFNKKKRVIILDSIRLLNMLVGEKEVPVLSKYVEDHSSLLSRDWFVDKIKKKGGLE